MKSKPSFVVTSRNRKELRSRSAGGRRGNWRIQSFKVVGGDKEATSAKRDGVSIPSFSAE
jgi:hypothetical protein